MIGTGIRRNSWFGHPRGLVTLFLTQTWEQFSYYGMRSILVYYMTTDLALTQQQSSLVFGAYVAFVYFTPLLGGALADRWLGRTRAVVLGSSIMALGHFALWSEPLFYVGLALIAIGNGLFLPSVPSQIGDLYAPGDPRHGAGFTIYYVGINIGGFLAPFVCGTLGELYGWHWGFGAAGVGMLAGLAIYVAGRRHLPPDPPRAARPLSPAGSTLRGHAGIVPLLLAIGLAVTIFRGAYQQVGNTVALWLDQGVGRALGDLTIPMTWFQSLNPLFVFALTPLLLAHWRRQAAAGREASPVRKMASGALLVGGAYVLLAAVAWQSGATPANPLWAVLFFAILTLGELCILPVGLYLFDRLAPPGASAVTIAAWYFTIFTGSLFSGVLGTLWSILSHAAFFLLLALAALAGAGLLRALERPVGARAQSMQTAVGTA